jgi:transposase-like protein
MDKRTRYSPEVQERAVRLVREHQHDLMYPTVW